MFLNFCGNPVFMKECFEEVDFVKSQQMTKKHAKLPSIPKVKGPITSAADSKFCGTFIEITLDITLA